MTIQQAIQQRIPRVRLKQWGPDAYLRLPLFKNGTSGPWAELYDERTQAEVLEIRPGSQRVLVISDDNDQYEPFTGSPSTFEQHANNFARIYAEA